MPVSKQLMFKAAGLKYDMMASKKQQKYYFIFVHEDGEGMKRISEIIEDRHIETSIDDIFCLDNVNEALKKSTAEGSKGKTILRII